MKFYMGIDPGQNGGIAVLEAGGEVRELFPMPATEKDVGLAIYRWGDDPVRACIEKVHAMPKQGVSSTFKFGMGYGGLRMAVILSDMSLEEVTPRTWQKTLGISPRKPNESKSQFKQRLKGVAQRIFPKTSGINLKTCDALMIAEYIRRKMEGLG